MRTTLRTIPAYRIKAEWPKVLPFIRRALEYDSGRYTEQRLFGAILQRDMQAWVAIDPEDGDRLVAVLITELINYHKKRACRLFLSAGDDLAAMLDHLPAIEIWAADVGCQSVEVGGRPGWSRALPGYRMTAVILEKELDHAERR